MKTILFFLFFICFNIFSEAQTFRYFIPDTISSRVVFLKVKGEEEWSKSFGADWHWRKERQLIEYIENNVFKVAFDEIDWKQMPGLTEIGVFFRFDKTYHIDYVHFVIGSRAPSRNELIRWEKNFLEYVRLIKKVDLSPYLYTDDPAKFQYGIGRFWLIREKSSVWNEK